MKATAPRMQIVLAGFYPPPFGGESIHVFQLARHLECEGLLKKVINLHRQSPNDLRLVNGAGPARLAATVLRALSRGAILHLHTNGHSWKSWAMVLSAAGAVRLRRRGAVLTLHSGLMPSFVRRCPPVLLPLLRWALRSFDYVVCVSNEIRAAVRGLGMSANHVAVIPAFLGVDGAPSEAPADDEWREFDPLIAVVAGAGPEYGLSVLIRAMAFLPGSFDKVGCIVIGTLATAELERLARRCGVEQRVRFLGPLPHAQCIGAMTRSSVVVRPSLADGDSVCVREALALGVPVVASDVVGRPVGTVLFKTGDSGDLARQIAGTIGLRPDDRGSSKTRNFVEEIVSLYSSVIQVRGRGRR